MIDVKVIRSDPETAFKSLARRGVSREEFDQIVTADSQWREAVSSQEIAKSKVKALSKEYGEANKSGQRDLAQELAAKSRLAGEEEKKAADRVAQLVELRQDLLLRLPNFPDHESPDGSGEADNQVIRYWAPYDLGENPKLQIENHFESYQQVPHWEIGEELGILDLARASKLSGAMFPMFRGAGARLVHALVQWALSNHTNVEGTFGTFEEIRPPTLVRTQTMVSTGALPKFSDDAYHVERDDLWAIPTAEVPLTSLYRDEILLGESLPMLFTAYTPCYRREAGSAGKDTRGLLRLHEFDKVEILALSREDQARSVHDELMARAQGLIEMLGLSYRVVDLCAGDLGISSARTFDIEVYSPGCKQWLEVSSVSWFSDYQARRANIRYRAGDELKFVNTMNGSAVAVPRVWAALVETYRTHDGSVSIPECLVAFFGGLREITRKA